MFCTASGKLEHKVGGHLFALVRIPNFTLDKAHFMNMYAPHHVPNITQGTYDVLPPTNLSEKQLLASIPCIAELAVVLMIQFLSTLSTEVLSHLVLSSQPPIARMNCCFLLGSVIAAIGGLGWLWCFRALRQHFTYHLAVRRTMCL